MAKLQRDAAWAVFVDCAVVVLIAAILILFVSAAVGAEPAPAPRIAAPQTYAEAVKLATEKHQPLVAYRGYYFEPTVKLAVVYRSKESDGIGYGFWLVVPWTGQMWQLQPDDKSIQAAVDYINSGVPAPVALPMAPPVPRFTPFRFDLLPPVFRAGS